MEKVKVEKQGRILIPKPVRERLRLRSGEKMTLEEMSDGIRLRLLKSPEEFEKELSSCVRHSVIRPLDVKKIWKM